MKENPYFEEAKDNYNKVERLYHTGKLKHTSTKYRFFAPSIKRQSEQYLFEANNPKRLYWKFDRGALVFIEFGVNIGGELSNNHWGIVLDKNDSPYKNTLTIVPITSKNKKGTVPIKEIIGYQPFDILAKRAERLEKVVYSYLQVLYVKNRETLSPRLLQRHKFLSEKYNLEDIDYNANLNDTETFEKVETEVEQLEEVLKYYLRYMKQSYAKCDSIQTISKDRILKKNPLDPVGKIKVSPETLDAINNKIKELYLDNK